MTPLNNRASRSWLLALLAGFVGLWQFHIPQFASRFDKFPGDRGDARLVAYLMEHWNHVFQGAVSWRSPEMFYPVQGTIGYADLVLGYGIVHSILRSLGLGVFGAAETTIILFNFLNYVVCFVLLYKILRFNLAASIAGAMFFAFNGPKLVQLGHLQLQPIVFLPLAVIAIVLFIQKRETLSQFQAFGLLALAALSLDLQLLTGFYPGWFFIFWSLLFLLLTLCFETTRNVVLFQVRKFWPALIGGVAVIILGFVPFVIAYLPVMRSFGGRPYDEIRPFIPVRWSLLLTGPRNYVWGRLSSSIAARHALSPEVHIGIGLVPSLAWLAVIVFVIWFLIRSARHIDSPRRMQMLFLSQLVIATCLFYAVGMTYWHGFSPWQFVYAYVPGAQAIRAVSRYALVLALPMSIAFAYTLHLLMQKIARHENRKPLFAVLFIVIAFGLFEQFGRKEGFDGFSISAEATYLNRAAQSLPNDCSSFYATVKPAAFHNLFEYQIDAAFVALLRDVPTLNGYSGQLPPGWYLWDMMEPGYENNVRRWIDERQIKGKVCPLFLRETTAPDDVADPEIFIRQQYLDMLRRLPDGPGLQTWLAVLNHCTRKGGRGADKSCDRESVSTAILQSPEFMERSYFVIRLYLAVLGRLPAQKEFLADREPLVTAQAAELKDKQAAVVEEFVRRPEFKSIYDRLSSAEFVDKLLATAQNTSLNRAQLVSELDSYGMTRERIVQVVLNDPQTIRSFQNPAFVLMQFFGNLDRDPEAWEYNERLAELNATGDLHQLVSNFIYSAEYRKRFGYVN